ncbi:hypothetical protein A1QO_00750 [Vibrio genomosp. F10 str. ZF-129]|uniref:Uncharacterized protein n=1 Tax=Vibrio genomosp. F10 str. ZF-129 TaxID=1187848 RepID=A0A1E5BGB8_9VIBR|nr:hypothetical protein [Vibrio genomosp. F10]OEE35321.1 hypothetical protein A1QO_00750 [Vibrio genomosp. F10 str. ZF-129]
METNPQIVREILLRMDFFGNNKVKLEEKFCPDLVNLMWNNSGSDIWTAIDCESILQTLSLKISAITEHYKNRQETYPEVGDLVISEQHKNSKSLRLSWSNPSRDTPILDELQTGMSNVYVKNNQVRVFPGGALCFPLNTSTSSLTFIGKQQANVHVDLGHYWILHPVVVTFDVPIWRV